MRQFFDKSASIVDVSDKEFIDTFQEGLFDMRTYIDFGCTCPTTITKLKRMVQAWPTRKTRLMLNMSPLTTRTTIQAATTMVAVAVSNNIRALPTASISQTTLLPPWSDL
jgi:hypothetical protein